jgi:hypothetical protein
MRYAVAAEGSQELRSRALPRRNRPPEVVPAGTVHALDVAAWQVACGRPLAGLVPFEDRDWAQVSSSNRRCPACVQATSSDTAAE